MLRNFPGATTQCIADYMKSSIRQPTCYKNPSNPACIDLILTNLAWSFQSTCLVETGLSDFHLMTLAVMRKSFKKYQPKIINYKSYKNFSNEKYRETLINNLSKKNLLIMMMVSKDSVT